MDNRLSVAKAKYEREKGPLRDLVASNFHDQGFVFPGEILGRGFSDWLTVRHYAPHPAGEQGARESIASYYTDAKSADRRSLPTPANRIIITASSSETYSLIFRTLAREGDEVLLPLPCYPLFEDLVAWAGLTGSYYPLDPSAGWQPDLEVLDLMYTESTHFLVLISPNNPTGSIISRKNLEAIVRWAEERDVVIISDEVFSEFLYEDKDLPRAAEFAGSAPVFTVNGVSKLFACPDLKVSWAALHGCPAEAEEIMDALEVRNDAFLSATSYSQHILPVLFREGFEFVESMRSTLAGNRLELMARIPVFEAIGVHIVPPSGGIHFVATLEGDSSVSDDEALALRLIQEHGIYVHPGYLYGCDEDRRHLVLSLLRRKEEFPADLDRLVRALKKVA